MNNNAILSFDMETTYPKENETQIQPPEKGKRHTKTKTKLETDHTTNATTLRHYYSENNPYEIGMDEAGRGPMFGRLYVAAVVLDKGQTFRHDWMKDSKKFHSEKKIKEVAEYIKQNCVSYHISYVEPDKIDDINIRQAVLHGMHECVRHCISHIQTFDCDLDICKDVFLLVDGNDFIPYNVYNTNSESIQPISYKTIEGGDNTYTSIAAASILAKVARDAYIAEMCCKYPLLDIRYGLGKNKGYGTKAHMDGIRTHGITQWHRKSFGLCAHSPMNLIVENDT